MTSQRLPETIINRALKEKIEALADGFLSIADAELLALNGQIVNSLSSDQLWVEFCNLVVSKIKECGYIVVRGVKVDEGRTLLILSSAIKSAFATYGKGAIVKRFRMSPWTDELSHTIRAGDFHTDGNVSGRPPLYTTMQCEQEDPGSPQYAEQRVAYLPDLLNRLASGTTEDVEALRFLTDLESAMAHERSSEIWRGRLVHDGAIRYHPHSIRLANKRLKRDAAVIEDAIAAVHRAALDVSVPFHTSAGDTVLVSNRRALHYRGPCSVRFIKFPTEFESRSLLVLHLSEPGE